MEQETSRTVSGTVPPATFPRPEEKLGFYLWLREMGFPLLLSAPTGKTAAHRSERMSRALTGNSFKCDSLLCARH